MEKMIAYCGLNCEKCDAYLATVRNDEALREKTAKLWSELNQTTIAPDQIRCEGCRADGVKTVYCERLCEIRQCALKRRASTCGACPDMATCPTLKPITEHNSSALENLHSLSQINQNKESNMNNHWQGKLWYAYGTSMTSAQMGEYVPVVAELSGMTVVNHGIPGGSLTPDGLGGGNVKRAVMNLEDGKEKADLITLEVLPNEGYVVGDIYDTDDKSFCGCFNQCLRYLQENTKAQIAVIVMIASNDVPPEHPNSKRGIPQFEFAEIIARAARLNGVPVINVFGEAGFGYARVKARDYQVDQIHLNKRGGLNMGRFVWSKLKDIPLWE